MPYKPTGKPPGRPRKPKPGLYGNSPALMPGGEVDQLKAANKERSEELRAAAKPLTRAREGFRRVFENPADALHHPPRRIKREVGKRPILHPNVIKG